MESSTTTAPFRVLSLDGGGVRGLYSAVLLHGIAKHVARQTKGPDTRLDIGPAFDLVVGTSTGAITASAIVAGLPLEDVIEIYKGHAKQIFANPTPPSAGLALFRWIWGNRNNAANSPDTLRKALVAAFSGETLGGVYGRRGIALCVPSVNIETQKAWVFKTPHQSRLQRDNDYSLVDVCMASAAAPVIFPIHGVATPEHPAKDKKWFVDGGLWANNPVLVGLTEALALASQNQPIEILSVSTCPPFQAPSIDETCANRGLLGWRVGIRMMETSIDAQAHAYDYVAKTIAAQFGGRISYCRLRDPLVSGDRLKELRLDNPSDESLRALVGLGTEAVDINLSEATTGKASVTLLMRIFTGLKQV